MLGSDFQGDVLSFDGTAKPSTKKGSCGCGLWQLPGWKVLKAKGFLLEHVTVNDAEYHGLLKGLEMAIEMRLKDLVAVGDSRIVIQQVQRLINCNQPHLQKHLVKVELLTEKFGSLRLEHLKPEYNQAADYLTTKTLILDKSWDVTDTAEIAHLEHVSKIAEKIMKVEDSELKTGVDPTSGETLSRDVEQPTAESVPLTKPARVSNAFQKPSRIHFEGPTQTLWNSKLNDGDAFKYTRTQMKIKDFLKEDFETFSPRRLRKVAKVADLFLARLVIARGTFRMSPDSTFQKHSGTVSYIMVTKTSKEVTKASPGPIRGYVHNSMGLAYVEHFVKECVDCASGKEKPPNAGPSPWNIEPRQPFEVVSMEFVTDMPKSDRGNMFLLLFQDMFSGYVICKPMDSTTAED
ncbi:LOW QUALITY PROTEIN: hypothetical protein PHMEG_00032443, partial [Phytophthora megakarya]